MKTANIVLKAIKSLNLAGEETVRIQMAYEAVHAKESGKNKMAIAKEFQVSDRTVGRNQQKHEETVKQVDKIIEGWEKEKQQEQKKVARTTKRATTKATQEASSTEGYSEKVMKLYEKIQKRERRTSEGRVRSRPSKHTVHVWLETNGKKDNFFKNMQEEGRAESFIRREYNRMSLYSASQD